MSDGQHDSPIGPHSSDESQDSGMGATSAKNAIAFLIPKSWPPLRVPSPWLTAFVLRAKLRRR
jgi:hypothetical protein